MHLLMLRVIPFSAQRSEGAPAEDEGGGGRRRWMQLWFSDKCSVIIWNSWSLKFAANSNGNKSFLPLYVVMSWEWDRRWIKQKKKLHFCVSLRLILEMKVQLLGSLIRRMADKRFFWTQVQFYIFWGEGAIHCPPDFISSNTFVL